MIDPSPIVEDRVPALLERAFALHLRGNHDQAVAAAELALTSDPDSAATQRLIRKNQATIIDVFEAFLGDRSRRPRLAQPLDALGDAAAPIGQRAAFLLSRIDGTLSLDDVLDISGMPKLEAYRHLAQLLLLGVLRL
jgi:hypothetical protein